MTLEKKIDIPWTLSSEDIIEKTDTNVKTGLTSAEAALRLEKYGENVLKQREGVSALKIFLSNANNIIVYLLVLSAAVSFYMQETVEGIAVIAAILIAVLSGFISEYKAQKSVESLQNMVKTVSKVRRDSSVTEVDSKNLVVGDVLFIEEGDSITADARIVQQKNFACIESSLTGESESVNKKADFIGENDTPIGDRINMVFSGTAATRGNAYAIITGTAMDTEIGKISDLLDQQEDNATPLEEQLDKLGKSMIVFAAIVAVIVTVLGILTGEEVYSMIKIGIILAIAAVPEALPAVSTITLAIGMSTMVKHNALVKSLPAVETLGSTTVICTDKTGTLTENQMTVKDVFLFDGLHYKVSGSGYSPEGDFLKEDHPVEISSEESLAEFIKAGVLSSNATLSEENGEYKVIGDPTEGGMIVLGYKGDISRDKIEKNDEKRIGEIPFSSEEKFMATVYQLSDNSKKVYIKGAPDVLIDMAKLNEDDSQRLKDINSVMTKKGMRVIAVAVIDDYPGDGSEEKIRESLDSSTLRFLGFAGITDPPREDVKQAIDEAQQAGIRVIMITGDHPKTAQIIAQKIGILNSEHVITGKEMDKLSDDELAVKIDEVSVFARVSPENKLQIVRALNVRHEVTAMTGDGVNDAPALNGADIGIAMGIRGTEVAKEAADMILTDDRFSTIVSAVKEGRIIFDNIEKFVYYLFSCNVVEILVVFLTILLGLPMPVIALQILWMNLVVDVLPAMSLAWEKGEGDVMKRMPRDPQRAILTREFLIRILGNGSLIGLGALAAFWYSLNSGDDLITARTISFSTMAFGQLFHIFNARERKTFGIDRSLLKNPFLIISLVISVVFQFTAIYVPFLNHVLETTPLSASAMLIVLAGSALPTAIIQIQRVIRQRGTSSSEKTAA